MSDVIQSGERTARMPHQCAYCTLTIPAGATVRWWAWTDGGRAETSYAHVECSSAARWDAAEYGLHSDEMPDPDEFRRETLPEFRAAMGGERGE